MRPNDWTAPERDSTGGTGDCSRIFFSEIPLAVSHLSNLEWFYEPTGIPLLCRDTLSPPATLDVLCQGRRPRRASQSTTSLDLRYRLVEQPVQLRTVS